MFLSSKRWPRITAGGEPRRLLGMGALAERLLTGLLDRLGAKLLLFAFLAAAVERVTAEDVRSVALDRLASLFIGSEAGQRVLRGWLDVVWQSVSAYWAALLLTLAASLCLVAAGHIPLGWRALVARRRRVFVSFQNAWEGQAAELSSVLDGGGFQVLRLPYQADATHQGIVKAVGDLLRQADALVCLPGKEASFVDAEVAAATVAGKPLLFLVAPGGTLPNTADKRYPSFNQVRASLEGYAPIAEFLHFVTQDLQSARLIYRRSWTHPAIGMTLWHAFLLLLFVSLGVFLASVVHGYAATSTLSQAADPDPEFLRWKAVLAMSVALLAGALVILPVSAWLACVAAALWRQLQTARRAALRARTAEFDRSDWVGVVPGMTPGEALYESMEAVAPRAHHEVLASPLNQSVS